MIPHSWLPKQAQALCEVERSYLLSEPFETSLSVHSHFGGAGFGSVSISPFPFMPQPPPSRSHYARTLFGTSPRGGGTVLLLTCHRSPEGPRSFATHIATPLSPMLNLTLPQNLIIIAKIIIKSYERSKAWTQLRIEDCFSRGNTESVKRKYGFGLLPRGERRGCFP